MDAKVVIENLWVKFEGEQGNVQALEDISFSVNEGEFLTILGPSGCGKSTLIRVIAGFQSLEKGKIFLGKKQVAEPGPDRIMVFQEFDQLFPWRTVIGNITYALKVNGLDKTKREAKANKYLEMVNLQEFARAFPHQLSGGMKQRAAIARSLALNPEILLMDEPFGSLDAQTRSILQAELVRIWQKVGSTIIFITHNIQEAILLGDRVMVMSSHPGTIKEIVDVEIKRPRLPETPEFMKLWHKLYTLLETKRFGENGRNNVLPGKD
ncbi:MAG: ABC transporter ATP-binding protein [Pelolinea sp.]|nr:ABC transporter ATP-binding protein [Pelolinea sp.]